MRDGLLDSDNYADRRTSLLSFRPSSPGYVYLIHRYHVTASMHAFVFLCVEIDGTKYYW